MPEKIEEIERDFDKVVPVHPRRDVRLDNTNYYKTYQDYQYRPHYVKGRDHSAAKDAHFIENTVKSLQHVWSLTQRDRDIILGTAIVVSGGISGLFRKIPDSGKHKEPSQITVDPFKYDLRLDNFDYCTMGNTREEILGRHFGMTRFANPGSPFAVMQAVFQRVVDDPFSSPQAV